MPRRGSQAHYEPLSEFERGRIIELNEAGWAIRRIARHMGRIRQITRSLSNPACLGHDVKATAYNRGCSSCDDYRAFVKKNGSRSSG
ncbi:hypothetical protein TNCV_1020591 [Trichonephila clavipes]|uniref:Transposase IS30-like HTH domain-containing protein n=1 Tax=Trichonephila clavipes TaxID=2585209 RepID=A0A8X6SIF4_TRICX|nr:hypothetical protein TNCV_1020591 [Trichonephila clavipes]